MGTDGEAMWSLLRSLDDPDHLEWPANFDFHQTRQRFDQLVHSLHAAFGCSCEADRNVEDASLHARVNIPESATKSGDRLVVCVSNFGGLATVSLTNPGAWSQAESETLASGEDAFRVHRALDSLGYTVVPEEPLWSDYDGPSDVGVDPQGKVRATWWTRYFDYL